MFGMTSQSIQATTLNRSSFLRKEANLALLTDRAGATGLRRARSGPSGSAVLLVLRRLVGISSPNRLRRPPVADVDFADGRCDSEVQAWRLGRDRYGGRVDLRRSRNGRRHRRFRIPVVCAASKTPLATLGPDNRLDLEHYLPDHPGVRHTAVVATGPRRLSGRDFVRGAISPERCVAAALYPCSNAGRSHHRVRCAGCGKRSAHRDRVASSPVRRASSGPVCGLDRFRDLSDLDYSAAKSSTAAFPAGSRLSEPRFPLARACLADGRCTRCWSPATWTTDSLRHDCLQVCRIGRGAALPRERPKGGDGYGRACWDLRGTRMADVRPVRSRSWCARRGARTFRE